jgi:hypothetical protein
LRLEADFTLRARQVDQARVIYTDNIEELYFLTGHHSFQVNQSDESVLAEFRSMYSQHPLAFIFFHSTTVPEMVLREWPHARLVFQEGSSIIVEVDQQ